MSTTLIAIACLLLALVSALVSGVLLAFSDFIMRGLAQARPAGGIEAMQGINRTVLRSAFLLAFVLLLPGVYGLAAYALFNLEGPGQSLIYLGAMIYLVTVFLVTGFGNVPMNKRLAGLDAQDDAAQAYWQRYLTRWTGLNHWRAAGSLATSLCFAAAAFMLV
ncbi:DUF1772 domain-containing protein [Maricaulis salignorans]|uniref:Uncharacterized membrane protein n=1 Tax=Maricaulis salignorans TaxID=144026 RepID=A0A1G9R614_9PROT|nr:anthrone oxygenase family protein [Maricaulis salignorans]SDM18746.1 Uncharacterized membrane protein [Maricaulis salignorans]